MPDDLRPVPSSDLPPSSTANRGRDALAAFKGDMRASLPLHPMEKAVLWIAILQVCSLPWMLGGMRPWAQFIALGLAALAFVVSLIPRHYAGDYIQNESFTLYPHRKLIRWPIFWIGLLFFSYVLIQALNPAWVFSQGEKSWSMFPIPHIEWLPTGMRTPFSMMNPWRQMMIWGAPFLLICALWIGFTRRKSVITLLTAIVINATVLAIVGIVARYTANGKVLWMVQGIKDYAFASFIYKNHAGSFFALAVGFAITLAIHFHGQATRHRRKSSPAGVLVFVAMVLMVAVLLTYSRAAILLVGAWIIVIGLITLIRIATSSGLRNAPFYLFVLLVAVGAFALIGGKLVNSEHTLDRLSSLTSEDKADFSVSSRRIAWEVGLNMSSEKPVYGWGAGGFRFLFPRFQVSRPEITYPKWDKNRFWFWEHAHNDYLQILIETGRMGAGLFLLAVLAGLFSFLRNGGFANSVSLTLLAATFISLAHAAVDFPLQNPAILGTLAVAFGLVQLLPSLQSRRS